MQLLQQGFHPDSADYDRRTALHLACANGHTETVRVLLAAGADTGVRDNFGAQPLHEACRRGHDPLIDLLLRRGARWMTVLVWVLKWISLPGSRSTLLRDMHAVE